MEEVFVISKIKITVPWTYDSNDEKIDRNFYEKELQKTDEEEFRVEKAIKRMEKKEYDNSFNSWGDQKGIV